MGQAIEYGRVTLVDAPLPPWFSEVGGIRERFILNVVDSSRPTSLVLREHSQVVVGRDPDVDVQLSCGLASRRHIVLHVGDRVEIEDLGSSNGTTVVGVPLPPRTRRTLQPGEVVLVGSVVLVLRRLVLGSVPPALVGRDSLLEGLAAATAAGAGTAIIKLRAAEVVPATWLATLLANAFGRVARLVDWGDGSWRLACVLPDQGTAEEARRFAVARLAFCGLQATSECVFFPSPVNVGQVQRHPILASRSGTAGAGVEIIARSQRMQALLSLVGKVAASDLAVLILGETGSGKELVASLVHDQSQRSSGPFLRLNCATLSESLLESELFGHEAGAFTGAKQLKRGLLEISDGGTVLLDEAAELPLSVQAKLLRVVEMRQFMRVGGSRTIPTDVRFVSATNRDLQVEAKHGRFREDLYYRLAGMTLRVPPLREHPEDIPALAEAFLESTARALGKPLHFSPQAMEKLCAYAWPGNVRELRNVVARSVLLSDGDAIGPRQVSLDGQESSPSEPARSSTWEGIGRARGFPFSDPIAARRVISEALEAAAGNQTEAARLLGISRRALVQRLEDYGFPRPRRKRSQA